MTPCFFAGVKTRQHLSDDNAPASLSVSYFRGKWQRMRAFRNGNWLYLVAKKLHKSTEWVSGQQVNEYFWKAPPLETISWLFFLDKIRAKKIWGRLQSWVGQDWVPHSSLTEERVVLLVKAQNIQKHIFWPVRVSCAVEMEKLDRNSELACALVAKKCQWGRSPSMVGTFFLGGGGPVFLSKNLVVAQMACAPKILSSI